MKNLPVRIALFASLLLSGCSHLPFTHHKADYSSAKPGEELIVPPDLTKPAENNRYSVPQAKPGAAPAPQPAPESMASQEAIEVDNTPTHARLSNQDNDITLDIPVDRAWRKVGLALEKVGFTVTDQNRENGVYFVDYASPKKQDQGGFLSDLEFWKDKEPPKPQKFRIQVRANGAGSAVTLLDKDGFTEHTQTSEKILNLLFEQLK
ncbi:MAG TPA: outer membrane protein assembly factor BamC [Burkholderiales bacterium]|nr:outer membrane protein assembly factor BamC [Burkholderiales bacterium]